MQPDKLLRVADALRFHAAQRPDDIALTYNKVDLSFRSLNRRASQIANGLAALGVRPQARVAHLDKNSGDFFEIILGTIRANIVLAPLNWRLAAQELASILNDAEAEVVFVGGDYADILARVRDELTTVRHIIQLDGADHGWPIYAAWRDSQSESDPETDSGPEDVCLQVYTSGTTGRPKGVQLTNSNMVAFLENGATRFDMLRPGTVNLVMMPCYHMGGAGWGLISLSAGVRTVVLREFMPAEVAKAVARYRITTAIAVPAMVLFMLQAPGMGEADFSSLRMMAYGASPMSPELLREARAFFPCTFCHAYGLTEVTGIVACLDSPELDPAKPEHFKSCGRPFAGTRLRVVDPSGNDLAPGETGEVLITSPQVMKGYWKKDAETSDVFNGEWFSTGDAGYVDAEGYLYIKDRIKDLIISGGENIFPAEVENALYSHPGVADAAVIGVPDPRWGESVKALVILKEGAGVTQTELADHCRGKIAGYKIPRSIDFVQSLPRNPTGKILKSEIRKQLSAGA